MNNEIEKRELQFEEISGIITLHRVKEQSGYATSADGFCTNAAIPYTDNIF